MLLTAQADFLLNPYFRPVIIADGLLAATHDEGQAWALVVLLTQAANADGDRNVRIVLSADVVTSALAQAQILVRHPPLASPYSGTLRE